MVPLSLNKGTYTSLAKDRDGVKKIIDVTISEDKFIQLTVISKVGSRYKLTFGDPQ